MIGTPPPPPPPPPVTCNYSVNASAICEGQSHIETVTCSDNSVQSQTTIGTKSWSIPTGASCPPIPGNNCSSTSICSGTSLPDVRSCTDLDGTHTLPVNISGTQTCVTCPNWILTENDVCVGHPFIESRVCSDSSTETRTIFGTRIVDQTSWDSQYSKIWNSPSDLATCSGVGDGNVICTNANSCLSGVGLLYWCSEPLTGRTSSELTNINFTWIGTDPNCGTTCDPFTITESQVCAGQTYTETADCTGGTTIDNVVTGTLPWSPPADATCTGTYPNYVCTSVSVCSGTTEDRTQTCTDTAPGGSTHTRQVSVDGTMPCLVICDPPTINASAVCGGETYTETGLSCDDGTTTNSVVTGSMPWQDPTDTVCTGTWPNQVCEASDLCTGVTADRQQTCTSTTPGATSLSRIVNVDGSQSCGSITCPSFTVGSSDVCAGESYTETVTCSDSSTQNNSISGTKAWTSPAGTVCGAWPDNNCDSSYICQSTTEYQAQTCQNNVSGSIPMARGITVSGTSVCAVTCPDFGIEASDVCRGHIYTENVTCDDSTTRSQAVSGTLDWTTPGGISCPAYPSTSCSTANECQTWTGTASQTCDGYGNSGYGHYTRAIQLSGTDTVGICQVTCPAWQYSAAEVCAGITFTEQRTCSDGITYDRGNLLGTKAWTIPSGDSICLGNTGTEYRTCLDTYPTGQVRSQAMTVNGTLVCNVCSPADATGWSPQRAAVCAGQSFIQTGTCANNETVGVSNSGIKSATVRWSTPGQSDRGVMPTATQLCAGETWTATASCSDSHGNTDIPGTLPNPARVTGTKSGATTQWRKRNGVGTRISAPSANLLCRGVTYDPVASCTDAYGNVGLSVTASEASVIGTKSGAKSWSCTDGSSPNNPTPGSVCSGVTCDAEASCSDNYGNYNLASTPTPPTRVSGTKPASWSWTWPSGVTGTGRPNAATLTQHCSSKVWNGTMTSCGTGFDALYGTKPASHRWSASGYSDRTTTPIASSYCPSVRWTDNAVCATDLPDIVGTKVCVCAPVTETWTSSGLASLSSRPSASSYCPGVIWTGTETCPGDPDVSLGTVTGTRASGEEWVHGSDSRTTRPSASSVCQGVTWTGSNDCGSLGSVVGTKPCVCTPVTETWTSPSRPSLSSRPSASSYCPGVIWTGTKTCPGDPDVPLGTVTGTRASGEEWVHGSDSRSTKPAASSVCQGDTWTGSNDCGSLGTVIGTKPCVCAPVTETWTSPGLTSKSSKPPASSYCAGVVWTGTETCPGDPAVSLGTVTGSIAARLTWTRASDGTLRYYAADSPHIQPSAICYGDSWSVAAVCTTNPGTQTGTKGTVWSGWTCSGNGTSYELDATWYTSLSSAPRAADVCRGITCEAKDWKCRGNVGPFFYRAGYTAKPADVVGTRTIGSCPTCSLTFTDPATVCDSVAEYTETKTCASGTYLSGGATSETRTIKGTKDCVCSPVTESWTSPGLTSKSSKPSGSSYCPSVTWTGKKTCPGDPDQDLGTVTGTKAVIHRWSSSGFSDLTTTPVASNYCPSVTWEDNAQCASNSADIVGTKATVHTWSSNQDHTPTTTTPVAAEFCPRVTWTVTSSVCSSTTPSPITGTKSCPPIQPPTYVWSNVVKDYTQPVTESCPDSSDPLRPVNDLLTHPGQPCSPQGAVVTFDTFETMSCRVNDEGFEVPYDMIGYRFFTGKQTCIPEN